jgi:hypothetical protein
MHTRDGALAFVSFRVAVTFLQFLAHLQSRRVWRFARVGPVTGKPTDAQKQVRTERKVRLKAMLGKLSDAAKKHIKACDKELTTRRKAEDKAAKLKAAASIDGGGGSGGGGDSNDSLEANQLRAEKAMAKTARQAQQEAARLKKLGVEAARLKKQRAKALERKLVAIGLWLGFKIELDLESGDFELELPAWLGAGDYGSI